jgi:hypothetical protein
MKLTSMLYLSGDGGKKPPSPDLTRATGCKHPKLNAVFIFIVLVSIIILKRLKQRHEIWQIVNHDYKSDSTVVII